MPSHAEHICNPALLRMARTQIKSAFIPTADMAGQAGGGGGGMPPPGGDPAAGGGMPPGGGAPPGMDPAAGGGAPPPSGDPSGGGGGDVLGQILQRLQRIEAAGGGAGGAGAGALKPKIDVNVAITQVLKILARIADTLGVQIPASEMVINQTDLMGMASATQSGAPMPGMDPTAGGAAGGAGGAGGPTAGGIAGPQPMPPMGQKAGSFDRGLLADLNDRAAALIHLKRYRSAS